MSKCQCGMTGAGCRYCQPQQYIGWMSKWLQESQEKAAALEADHDQLKAANYLQEVRLKDAFEVIDQLKAENEWLGYEVEHLGVVGLQQVSAMLKAQQESDTLRKQLDEALVVELPKKYVIDGVPVVTVAELKIRLDKAGIKYK